MVLVCPFLEWFGCLVLISTYIPQCYCGYQATARRKFLIFKEQNPYKDILIPCKAITEKLRLNLHFLLGHEAIRNECTACLVWLDKSKISFRWVVVHVKIVSTNADCLVVFRFTRRIVDVIDQSHFWGKAVQHDPTNTPESV